MAVSAGTFELGRLRLTSGEGRRFDLVVRLEPFALGDERYDVRPDPVPVRLDVNRTTGEGYALRLRFEATLEGPCMRCLEPASPTFAVDAREVSQPGAGEELESPYVDAEGELALHDWARDALVLALPPTILCRPDCAGLCPECGADLNQAGPDHAHERAPDPRWAALRDLDVEGRRASGQ
jgi:uncharacterized protein